MLIIGFNGTDINQAPALKNTLASEGLGGVLLFDYDLINKQPGKNLQHPEQIKRLNQQLQSCFESSGQDLPLFIAVDYEGGAVDRLREIDACMPTLTALQFARLPADQQTDYANQMAETLKSLGFNLNFAPVVDLNLNSNEGIIGRLKRSFSSDAAEVTRVADIFVQEHAKQAVVCCYKHFPGHGSAAGDSHEGFVDVSETFQSAELEPYRILLRSEKTPAMVMTAHVINRQLDSSGLPATLSQRMLTGILRDELGFDGVIVSDDLQMQAISSHFSMQEALRLSINAGADMVIFANQLGSIEPQTVIDFIESMVLTNAIEPARIDEAYRRIVRLKMNI